MRYEENGTLRTSRFSPNEDRRIEYTDFESATLDSLVIDDGRVRLEQTTVPDAEDLFVHYDAQALSLSDGETVSVWPDESGHDRAATGSDPTFRANRLNDYPAVEFNGDWLSASTTPISQPFTVFVVARSDTGVRGDVFDSENTDDRMLFEWEPSQNSWKMLGGSVEYGGSNDGTFSVFSLLCDGSHAIGRQDGTRIISGDVGTTSLNGITLGNNRYHDTGLSGHIAELLVFPQDKSAIFSDVEQHLAEKWGMTI